MGKSNQFKNQLAEKEAKDYNDLKHIAILLGLVGLVMFGWCAYVLFAL